MICRVCNKKMNYEQTVNVLFENYYIYDVNAMDENLKVEKKVDVYLCDNCTHRQTEYLLSDVYYEDAQVSGGARQYSGNLCKNKDRIKKLKEYALTKESLIEIGCGAGYGLVDAREYFENVVGVDPCKNEVRIAKEKNLNVICEEFNSKLQLGDKYSAFMSFQVFEHLSDLYEVLNYAYDILEDGGVGLINVPDGQYIFNKGVYHQVVCEHVNYLTPFSLAYCCKKAKFDILEINPCRETMELNIYVRKNVENIKMEEIRENHKEKLRKIISGFENIAIYGAGAKTSKYMSLLNAEDRERIKYLFDGDKQKEGKFVYGINSMIKKVSSCLLEQIDLVIIFASSYNAEIIKLLKEDYRYTGRVGYFENNEIRVI